MARHPARDDLYQPGVGIHSRRVDAPFRVRLDLARDGIDLAREIECVFSSQLRQRR
jgi:hypothetical protein